MPKILRCDDGRDGRNMRLEHNHDDRLSYHGTRDKVSFKTQARRARDVPMDLAPENINENMQEALNSNCNQQVIMAKRNKGIQLGRNRRIRKANQKRVPLEESSWYKITIRHGHNCEKDYILNNLLNCIAPNTFVPIMYKVSPDGINFYVDDYKTAVALRNCNRKITTTQGNKLKVRVKIPPFPQCENDAVFNEKLKQVIGKRYTSATRALDLSKLHEDPDLTADYFCALFQPLILQKVINIISEQIPDLEALNLDRNKLDMIQPLCTLKLLKLKILHIGDNSIKNINEIDVIKDLKLEELKLAGNPLCNNYQTRNDYIKDVQKRFPELLRLDGVYLTKLVSCDVTDEENNIAATKRTFVVNEAQQVASQFLQEYFRIFDSENRESLSKAFTEDACFSMTAFNTRRSRNSKKNKYLMNRKDKSIRQKLKLGRFQIMELFSKMPRTLHYLNTLTMDISLITETMMFVTVTGLYKELNKKGQPVRYFKRTFMIIPEESGCCIKNEQLHISPPTEEQLKQLDSPPTEEQLKQLDSQPNVQETNSGADMIVQKMQMLDLMACPKAQMTDQEVQMSDLEKQMSSLSTRGPSPVELPEDIKRNMILKLSEETKMNLEWSLKCLEELSWNYDNAFSAFETFQKQGQIPEEAFRK